MSWNALAQPPSSLGANTQHGLILSPLTVLQSEVGSGFFAESWDTGIHESSTFVNPCCLSASHEIAWHDLAWECFVFLSLGSLVYAKSLAVGFVQMSCQIQNPTLNSEEVFQGFFWSQDCSETICLEGKGAEVIARPTTSDHRFLGCFSTTFLCLGI